MDIRKKLKIVEYVTFGSWRDVMDIVKLYNEDKVELIEVKFFDWYAENYKNNLKELKNWSTFSECVDVELNEKTIEFTIWDGDSFGGHRKNKRFIAIFKRPKSIVDYSYHINKKFNRYLEEIYFEEEQLKKEKRLKEIENEIDKKL